MSKEKNKPVDDEPEDDRDEFDAIDDDEGADERRLAENGRVSIDDPVYFEIAYREARTVEGVVDVKGSFFEMLTGHAKGVRVRANQNAVILELRLAVEYGRYIPDIVSEVRKKIAHAILSMTDRDVRSIKITIDRLVEGIDQENDLPRLEGEEDTEHIDF